MFLFADDAKLISSDNFALQNAIHKIYTWINVRQLRLAPTNIEHLPLHQNSSDNHTFTIENAEICSSNYVKDLGVYVSNDIYHMFVRKLLLLLIKYYIPSLLKMFGRY